MQCHNSIHCIVGMFNDKQWVIKGIFFLYFLANVLKVFIFFQSVGQATQLRS